MKPVDFPFAPKNTDDPGGESLRERSASAAGSPGRDEPLGSVVHSVLSQLAEGTPGRRALLEILSEVMATVDSERIFLFRLRRRGGFHVLASSNRDREPLDAPERRMSHYAVKVAMSSEKRLFIPDARHDRRYRAEEVLDGKKGALSILVLPLRVDGELYGGIYADHRFQTVQPDADSGTLRLWLSIIQLVLSRREQRDDLRRCQKELETRGGGTPAEVVPAGVDDRPRRSSRALDPGKWIEETPDVRNFHGFISANPDLKDAFDSLERLAAADLPVLIYGETGVGKSLLARAIHESSTRRTQRFLTVHCGSVPDALVESELLGHVKGAFSGAELDHEGIVVQADQGTLFFDGVGDMGAEVQTKLLRVLEDGVVRPVGAKESIRVDVRFISATRHPLEEQVEAGQFRRDLYFRLKGVVFEIAPLRERREDILPLCRWFLSMYAKSSGTRPPSLTRGACLSLLECSWSGNVREVENEMRRLVALGVDEVGASDLLVDIERGAPATARGTLPTLEEAVSRAERDIVEKALSQSGGNRSRAADVLGITRKSLYRRMKKYGLT